MNASHPIAPAGNNTWTAARPHFVAITKTFEALAECRDCGPANHLEVIDSFIAAAKDAEAPKCRYWLERHISVDYADRFTERLLSIHTAFEEYAEAIRVFHERFGEGRHEKKQFRDILESWLGKAHSKDECLGSECPKQKFREACETAGILAVFIQGLIADFDVRYAAAPAPVSEGVPTTDDTGTTKRSEKTAAKLFGVTAWHEFDVVWTLDGLRFTRHGKPGRARFLKWAALGLANSKNGKRLLAQLAQSNADGITNPRTDAHRDLVRRTNKALCNAVGLNENPLRNIAERTQALFGAFTFDKEPHERHPAGEVPLIENLDSVEEDPFFADTDE